MTSDSLVGTWRLVSFEVQDESGAIAHPFGQEVEGFITYTADGRMAVHFGAGGRAHLEVSDWVAGPEAEIAAAARRYFAYCGTYDVRGDTVTHHVESSLMPNWIGGEQSRHVAMNGNTITLSTPPTLVDGRQQVATLVWSRV